MASKVNRPSSVDTLKPDQRSVKTRRDSPLLAESRHLAEAWGGDGPRLTPSKTPLPPPTWSTP